MITTTEFINEINNQFRRLKINQNSNPRSGLIAEVVQDDLAMAKIIDGDRTTSGFYGAEALAEALGEIEDDDLTADEFWPFAVRFEFDAPSRLDGD